MSDWLVSPQMIDHYIERDEEPAPDLMVIFIDDLEWNEIQFDLSEIGAVYPDDDVIYISGLPCRLSTARPNPRCTRRAPLPKSGATPEGDTVTGTTQTPPARG